MKTGVLLINLGTPDAPETGAVRRYLRQFLMDPHVVDIPAVARWLLVNLVILPTRPAKSAEAYRKVWTERGSPLLFHTEDLTKKVQRLLTETHVVRTAMRYGNPSIESAVKELVHAGVERVIALPLYPQFSLAATESSVGELRRAIRVIAPKLAFESVPAFYANPAFISAFADTARESLQEFGHDHLVFSFHGLPERQVKKTDPTGAHCLASESCCDRITDANRDCYRAQCFQTAHRIASELGLGRDRYSISFQSRLGRTPWIKPYTDFVYPEIARSGVKRLAVMSPSFVADCLETLEEIQIRGKEQFVAAGGEDLKLVPSLNSRDDWASAVAALVRSGGSAAAG